MKAITRALGHLNRWMISRPTMAAVIALNVFRDGFGFGWWQTVALVWLTYCVISDGDKTRRRSATAPVVVKIDADQILRAAHKRRGGLS